MGEKTQIEKVHDDLKENGALDRKGFFHESGSTHLERNIFHLRKKKGVDVVKTVRTKNHNGKVFFASYVYMYGKKCDLCFGEKKCKGVLTLKKMSKEIDFVADDNCCIKKSFKFSLKENDELRTTQKEMVQLEMFR